jgi:hypothetical protein
MIQYFLSRKISNGIILHHIYDEGKFGKSAETGRTAEKGKVGNGRESRKSTRKQQELTKTTSNVNPC